jgi:hypothetical protein
LHRRVRRPTTAAVTDRAAAAGCKGTAVGEDCLERLRADLCGWLALLTHDSGTLAAWTGPGDPAAMAHYCQARADRDADLTHY